MTTLVIAHPFHRSRILRNSAAWLWLVILAGGATREAAGADVAKPPALRPYDEVRPLLVRYCHECHAGETLEAEIDLAAYKSLDDLRRQPRVWQKVGEMLDSGQMPPPEAAQPTDVERQRLRSWVREFLTVEAAAHAGDPGPVVLRRLSNVEYTCTLRDLTGVPTLDPAHEFPADSAAGEGFTNVGQALVMSPALLTKYLDAAKEVAAQAVLLPDGIRFSPFSSRRDWTNERLDEIRRFYDRYTAAGGGSAVNLQGIQFATNQGGRLPIERYLEATLAERHALAGGQTSVAVIAQARGLSPKYLDLLWRALTTPEGTGQTGLVRELRTRWWNATSADVPALTEFVGLWQNALWKFNTVGQIAREGSPKSWQEGVNPILARQDFRVKLATVQAEDDVVLYLASGDAGDGNEHDFVVWERPRLVAPGRPDLLLRDVPRVLRELTTRRERYFSQAAQCLDAAAEASTASTAPDAAALATKHSVDVETLKAWLEYLGINVSGTVPLGKLMDRQQQSGAGYDFIQGWVGDDALSVVANSSDQHVRIPGNMKPHSVACHPTPTLSVAVGWRSPVTGMLTISGSVQHAHPECGNGVAWSVELRRGNTRQRLAGGNSAGATVIAIGPLDPLAIRTGDVISLVINPRDGNHSCDLTAMDLTLSDGSQEWNLWRDVSPNILAGNPHSGVWHFYSEPAGGSEGYVIPAGSLLAKWQSTTDVAAQKQLAKDLQTLLQQGPQHLPADSPDVVLHQQMTSLGGPLLLAALSAIAAQTSEETETGTSRFGLAANRFGLHPQGGAIEPASLCVHAPEVLEIRLPADLVAGAEFVTTGWLHAETGREGSAQLSVQTARPQLAGLSSAQPVLVAADSAARQRITAAFDQFRSLFPPALCYTKIVPVDEVVTLTLYYREDEPLQRLMLTDNEAAQLDRMWDELLYVAREPFEMVTAITQLKEFATQDRQDLVPSLEALRQPIAERATQFRQRLIDNEPAQLAAVLTLAEQAYRRPLIAAETEQLRTLYAQLRKQDLPHDEALRLTLARVLVAPAFLYRAEKPGPGKDAGPVSDWELASRLSYFLWSSQPDEALRSLAAAGRLSDPEVLVAQLRRMLGDPKARRLATEFVCRWLHIHDFDHLDEKSERVFPTFAGLRGAMYEESILNFTDFFQDNGSILDLLAADHTYLNEDLARHYGIPNVTGPEWRRVEGVGQFHRGGILTQATTLAKQSGASRTSPILRGNWISEVVLGEKLPRPPKNVPQLEETVPDGLTERQLIERHSSDAACAKCHARIDPFGFSLESYDAIGRYREQNAGGLPIDTKTSLPDGTKIDGLTGLRDYLLTARRDAFLRQFHRKLLGYALGRSVQLSDEPLLTELHDVGVKHDFHIVPVLETIVRSRQFRNIRGREAANEE